MTKIMWLDFFREYYTKNKFFICHYNITLLLLQFYQNRKNECYLNK